MSTLTKVISKSVFGSAVAGFGFSLGNDIYKSAKGKNGSTVFILLLTILAFFGAYTGGLFVTRNYKHWFLSILMIVIGLLLAGISAGFVTIVFGAFGLAIVGAILAIVFFFAGIVIGLAQRKKRKLSWVAEKENKQFLEENGLIERDGFIFDSNGQKYRVHNQTPQHIELFAISRRNKRGFLHLNEDGLITNWSGMVKV